MELLFKFNGILSNKLSLLLLFIIPIIFIFPIFNSVPSGRKIFLLSSKLNIFDNKSRTGREALLISSNIIIFFEFFSFQA